MRRLVAALAVAALGSGGCGGSAPAEPLTATAARAGAALEARLEAKHLSVRAVSCVDSGIDYQGAASFRCKVDFGDPHIIPYCAVFLDNRLTTDRERPAIRCYRPEDAERYREAALLDRGG